MVKKRLFIIGSLLVLCIVGQIILRPCLGEDKALGTMCAAATQTADSNAVSNWKLVQDSAPKGLASDTGFVGKFISMIAIVAAIGLAGWIWVKKMNVPWAGGKNRHLSLIETMSLGPRRTVYLIQAGKKQLLVGGGPEGLRLISDLGETAVIQTEERK